MRQTFRINTDHFQFYLEDTCIDHDMGSLWDWNNVVGNQQLAVLDGVVAIGTARWGQNTTVVLEMRRSWPFVDDDHCWEQIAEASIRTVSGVLFLTTPEGQIHQAPMFVVAPGTYRVRVYYGNLSSVQDDFALDGADVYQLTLWPDSFVVPCLLKDAADV